MKKQAEESQAPKRKVGPVHEKKLWRIYDKVIESITPWGALGIYLEKGRFGLNRDHWRFTKMPRNVWVATFIEGRNLERPSYRIIELDESKKDSAS